MLAITTHQSANWVIQAIKNLVMDLDDAGRRARYLIRDRDGNLPALMGSTISALNSGVNERRGRGFFFPMLSIMDILPGTSP
ncbi:hypothetical protein ACWDRB_66410 [Nonomuraea sp. NPDC003707]